MVFVSVVKASEPPERIADLYWPRSPTTSSPSNTRNFVPFHRSPSAEYQASLHWRHQQQPDLQQPTDIQDELETVHWRRIGLASPDRPNTLPIPVSQHLDHIESYPEFGSEMPSYPRPLNSPTFSASHNLSSPGHTPDGKENTKRWSFGGLFKRKEKGKSPAAGTVPASLSSEPSEQQHSTPGVLQSPESESSPESEPRSNFLRRLSKKKKKPKGDGSKPVEGFLKVPSHPVQHRRSIPDAVQSWETTKLAPPNLLTPGNTNYSSSGSLSISLEGSSSQSRGSRAAAKEAVKARAEARRESILIDSSSGEDGEEERGQGHSGSYSSLSGRPNRRTPRLSPASKPIHSSPIQRVSNSSPNIYRGSEGSSEKQNVKQPRWEARIVYTQETLPEDEPVFVRLPKQRLSPHAKDSNGNRQYITQNVSDDKIITAGLRLPLQLSSSYPSQTEPIYANLSRIQQTQATPPQNLRDIYMPLETRSQNQNLISNPTTDAYHPASYFFDAEYQRSTGNNGSPVPKFGHGGSPGPKFGHGGSPVAKFGHYPQRQWSNNNQFRSNTPTIYGNNNLQNERWTPQQDQNISSTYEQQHEPRLRRHLASPLSMKNQEVNQNLGISKLGFPVKKLQQQQHQSSSSGAVQQGSWPKADRQGWSPFQNSKQETQHFENFQRESPLNRARIRSADSSPVPVTKHAKIQSPLPIGMLRSNESISSLSSFSAETPSPNIFGSSKNSTSNATKKYPAIGSSAPRTRRLKSSEFKITTPTPGQPPGESRSACERLNVKGYTPSPPPPVLSSAASQAQESTPTTVLEQKATSRKSPGKNLEDALNELEDMYKSLRLSDEDLLDRAERRDLPTLHQELREKEPVTYSTPRYFRFASSLGSGSLESVATTSGSGSTDGSRRRVRAPPLRRSGVPDPVNDDMAKRKYDPRESSKVTDPREVMGQTGSYLAFSPAFSPPVSPCPGEQLPGSPSPYSHRRRVEPDLVVDDVAVRNIRDANAIRIIEEPQPLFGVPLGPITKAPDSDYLHATPKEKFRPLFRHVKNPDIVKDDQAFRNLRKDLNQENNLNKNWTPRLFSPQQSSKNGSSDSVFNYNIYPETAAISGNKKLRAVRSLSANISHIVNPPNTSSALREEIGKWNSYTDLVGSGQRSSRSLTPSRSNFRQASWVEQANLEGYGTPDTVYRPPSPKSNIKKKFKLVKPPVKPTPPPPDPNAPRRPWTDLILKSFNDDEESAKKSNVDSIRSPVSEEDNDLFLDALPRTPSESPPAEAYSHALPVSQLEDHFKSFGKERPGSYADPRSSTILTNQREGPKRRSWSEAPKQFDSLQSAHEAIAGTPKPMVFNPLPTPRRIRQISLEGFSNSGSVPENETHGEQELNDLIDALVKDADNCGVKDAGVKASSLAHEPVAQVRKKRPSRPSNSLEKDTKWQAAIAELESPVPKSLAAESSPRKKIEQTRKLDETADNIVKTETAQEPEESPDAGSQDLRASQSAPRIWKKATSEPPPAGPIEGEAKGSFQGYPRGILKNKGPTQGLSPIPSPRMRSSVTSKTNKIKTNCGSTSNCIPSLLQRQQRQTTTILETSNEIPAPKLKTGEVKRGQLTPTPNSSETTTRISSGTNNGSSPILLTPTNPPTKEKASPPIGMSGLRRLLMRESSANSSKKNSTEDQSKKSSTEEQPVVSKGVKKSPSTGTLPSYWSRISSNQPSFLKRFFERVNPTSVNAETHETPPIENELTEIEHESEPEPILSMTVAQKASHFMQLEHSQRFSKWRNLDNNDNKIELAMQSKNRTTMSNDSVQSITSPARMEEEFLGTLDLISNYDAAQGSKVKNDDTKRFIPNETKTKLNSLTANGMSTSEPSKLSLQDRVQMFNRLTSVPSIVRVKTIETESVPFCQNNVNPVDNPPKLISSFQSAFQKMAHPTHKGSSSSTSLNYFNPAPPPPIRDDTSRSYDKLTSGFPLFRNHSTNAFPMMNGTLAGSGTFGNSQYNNIPVSKPVPVITKKRIKYVSHSMDNDLSEDGEVSSGGMEVAEIISKSYENSPLVQKKCWGGQKSQTGRCSRDLRRKYHATGLEDNISQWSTATELPEVNSFQKQGPLLPKVTSGSKQGPPRTQTSTSNLLSLLTAMSSSDDQLDEPEPTPMRYPPPTSKSRSCNMVNQLPVAVILRTPKLLSGN